MLAIQVFPLGCAKVGGRLLAVHADDPDLTYRFARRFLEHNRKIILMAQQAKEKKLSESPHRAGTLLIDTLLMLEQEKLQAGEEGRPVSITAYHLSNSGQGVDLAIYHLPLEITGFLLAAMAPKYSAAWEALRNRGWEIIQGKHSKNRKDDPEETAKPRFNVLYEDLFRLPDDATRFIRRYFLRTPERGKFPGDPRAVYSLRTEAHLVSWDLTELFLKGVVDMEQNRIQEIRNLGDKLAEYVNSEYDKRFFHSVLTARRYDDLRAALIRVSIAQMKRGLPPVVTFDPYVEVFEQGEELPYSDWRLVRDLLLIRMIERLHELGWIQTHVGELPEPEVVPEEE